MENAATLSTNAYAILGMLAWRPMSGYDVKAVVDRSIRFFWAASYGQIYPELRRLADAGLVVGEAEPDSGRRRTVYRLTPDGELVLRDWLARQPRTFEMRDEGLLKLFLAAAAPDSAAASLEAKRRYHETKLEQLRQIQASGQAEGFTALVLRFGIESSQWTADWCGREAERLRSTGARR